MDTCIYTSYMMRDIADNNQSLFVIIEPVT